MALLDDVIEAHGGLARRRAFTRIEATAVTTGGLFPLKGLPTDTTRRRMTVWLREQRASVAPFGAPDQRTAFSAERIAVEKIDGTVVAESRDLPALFAGHALGAASARLFQRLCDVALSLLALRAGSGGRHRPRD